MTSEMLAYILTTYAEAFQRDKERVEYIRDTVKNKRGHTKEVFQLVNDAVAAHDTIYCKLQEIERLLGIEVFGEQG